MGEARTKSMRVRVTEDERATIDRRATAAGFESSSEFVRALALGTGAVVASGLEVHEPAASVGTPAPAPSPDHNELEVRFRARLAELRKEYPLVVARRMANRDVYGAPA